MTTLQEALTPDVRAFCEREGLLDYLHLTEHSIADHYDAAGQVVAELVEDPDSGGAWVALTVPVRGTVPEVLDRDDAFLARWTTMVPWPQRGKIVVDPAPI